MQDAPDNPAPYRAAVAELDTLLAWGNVSDEFAARVRRLLSEEFQEFVVVILQEAPAAGAPKAGMILKPSETFARLVAAVRAADTDALARIEHEVNSLTGVAP